MGCIFQSVVVARGSAMLLTWGCLIRRIPTISAMWCVQGSRACARLFHTALGLCQSANVHNSQLGMSSALCCLKDLFSLIMVWKLVFRNHRRKNEILWMPLAF